MPHTRAPSNTTVTLSMSKELVSIIDDLAKKENRSRSNMISYLLQNEINLAMLAEDPALYKANARDKSANG